MVRVMRAGFFRVLVAAWIWALLLIGRSPSSFSRSTGIMRRAISLPYVIVISSSVCPPIVCLWDPVTRPGPCEGWTTQLPLLNPSGRGEALFFFRAAVFLVVVVALALVAGLACAAALVAEGFDGSVVRPAFPTANLVLAAAGALAAVFAPSVTGAGFLALVAAFVLTAGFADAFAPGFLALVAAFVLTAGFADAFAPGFLALVAAFVLAAGFADAFAPGFLALVAAFVLAAGFADAFGPGFLALVAASVLAAGFADAFAPGFLALVAAFVLTAGFADAFGPGFLALVAASVLAAGFADAFAPGFFDAGPAALVVDAARALGGEAVSFTRPFGVDFAVAVGFAEAALALPVGCVCACPGDLALETGLDFVAAAIGFFVWDAAVPAGAVAADSLVFPRPAEDWDLEEGFFGVVAFMCLRHSAMFERTDRGCRTNPGRDLRNPWAAVQETVRSYPADGPGFLLKNFSNFPSIPS